MLICTVACKSTGYLYLERSNKMQCLSVTAKAECFTPSVYVEQIMYKRDLVWIYDMTDPQCSCDMTTISKPCTCTSIYTHTQTHTSLWILEYLFTFIFLYFLHQSLHTSLVYYLFFFNTARFPLITNTLLFCSCLHQQWTQFLWLMEVSQ